MARCPRCCVVARLVLGFGRVIDANKWRLGLLLLCYHHFTIVISEDFWGQNPIVQHRSVETVNYSSLPDLPYNNKINNTNVILC